MSMVEDAAAALYADWVAEDIGNEYCSWEQLGDKETWLRRARAVLTALMEPSEGMLEAGTMAAFMSRMQPGGAETGLMWKAMLTAALEEG